MTNYDAIAIGTGQSGPALARRLAGSGMKVAIVERGRFGGSCVNTGCRPTKTLVACAYDANASDGDRRRVSDRIPVYALYTDPPLGRAAMTEGEVRRSGRRALVRKIAMEDVSRAFEKGDTEGFMKVLVNAESKLILGVALLSTSGDEAVHCVLDTMYAKAPYTVLQGAVHIHPTIAEFIPTILGDLIPLTAGNSRPPKE